MRNSIIRAGSRGKERKLLGLQQIGGRSSSGGGGSSSSRRRRRMGEKRNRMMRRGWDDVVI